jgi:hypothetical protein
MNRATLTTALLTSFVCAMTLACSSSADAPPQAQADQPPIAVEPAVVPPPVTSTVEIPAPIIEEPVLASIAPVSAPAPSPEPATSTVGGVGASGIHLDDITVGKGWAASRCEDLGARFEVETDDRVNVCFRVVHPRVAETVTVEWAREGKVRQTIDVSVKPTHRYRTRAWLPVSAGRAGEWTATVKSTDGVVLGSVEFEIID